MLKKKQSRLETSKEVRRVLNRHGVDLSFCVYSCYGLEVRLSGWLCKTDGSDFNTAQIEGIINDFQRSLAGYNLFGEFDNWHFSTERITFVGDRDEIKLDPLESEELDVELDKKS